MSQRLPPLRLPPPVQQHLFTDEAEMAATLAWRLAEALSLVVKLNGTATLVVSGGRSPVKLFEALSRAPLDWSRVFVTLADERWVAPDSEDSNERLVRRHLLRGPAAAAHFVPLKTAADTPEAGLAQAEAALERLPLPFDIVLLGAGEDGHTASLFPCAAETPTALDCRQPARVAAIRPQRARWPRVSLSLRALLEAQTLVLLTQGAAKRAVLERAADCGEVHGLPVSAVLRQTEVPVHLYHCDEPT